MEGRTRDRVAGRPVKVAVIGGGSVFSPELGDLLARKQHRGLEIAELVLMDTDLPRVEITAGLIRRIVAGYGVEMPVTVTDKVRPALDGADFVLLQLRAGGQEMRIADERIGLRHRIPFVETVSVCGVGALLRTFPVYESLAADLAELAPGAWVMSFANPAGPLTEYLHRLGVTKAIGLCNIPVITQTMVADALGVDPGRLVFATRGLNHLTVTDAILLDGQDILPRVLTTIAAHPEVPFSPLVSQAFPYLLNPYMQYYLHQGAITEKLLAQPKTRGERVLELEEELLSLYADPDRSSVPELLTKRGGYRYSLAVVGLMSSLVGSEPGLHYINVRNDGAVPGLPDDSVVEVPAWVGNEVVLPLRGDRLPGPLNPLVSTMAEHYHLLLDAVSTRSKLGLVGALTVHPLIRGAEMAGEITDELLGANAPFIPAFT